MNNAVTDKASTTNTDSSQIQQLAWIIVMVSFVMFCSFSVALSGGIYYFLFQSTLPMDVTIQIGQGSVGVITSENQQIVRRDRIPTTIPNRPAILSTGTLDQGIITFNIPSSASEEEIVIGTITLKNGSSITLDNARRPRFAWSNGSYLLEYSDFFGEAEIFITEIPDRPLNFRIRTALGNATYVFDTLGRYSISANNETVRVTTHEGRALMISPDNRNNRSAVAGEEITLLTGANLPVVTFAPINLIDNGQFAFNIVSSPETGQLQMPSQLGCFSDFEGAPSGQWFPDVWNGRSAIRLLREIGTDTSRTGCRHWLDVSVTDYTYLELQATFALSHQSLVNCGIAGSECPMMIFMRYNNAQGAEYTWYQSFFYNFDPQNPAPLICQECTKFYDHRPIADEVWYSYESGNLFARLSEEERPVQILDITFYASGHRYDVLVSEISLIAGTEQVPVPLDQIPDEN